MARQDLVAAWNRQHPGGEPLPPVQVIDLVGVFENMLRGRANNYLPSTNLVFVPNEETLLVARELKSKGLAPYNPDRMII